MEKLDFGQLNEMVKEYFAFHGLESTLDCFLAEEKTKGKRRVKVPVVKNTFCNDAEGLGADGSEVPAAVPGTRRRGRPGA